MPSENVDEYDLVFGGGTITIDSPLSKKRVFLYIGNKEKKYRSFD